MDKKKINERKRKEYHLRKNKNCLWCGSITTNKYCNNKCQNSFEKKNREDKIFKSIEKNENLEYIGGLTTQSRWVKKYLIKKYGDSCMECGWNERHPITDNVPIELEHIDGDSSNNKLKNVKLLCPNCHSLTPTYKALNTGNGRYKRRMRYQEGKSY